MTDKEHIEDSIVKFKGYSGIITDSKDIYYYKRGDYLTSNKIFYRNMYLDLYIFVLEYSLGWFDESDDYSEDSPITITELNTIINRGNELIKSIIEQPLIV